MDQGQLSRYRQAILGGALPGPASSAPAVTPDLAGTFSHIQALGNSDIQGTVAKHSTNAFGGASQSVADQDEANAKLALQQEQDKADALAKAKEDMQDPSKYREELDEKGGYQFFDPAGNKIDVKQYSAVTGKHITDILKKSQNPEDQEFVRNYNNVEKIGQILQAGSKDDRDKFFKDNPDAQTDYDLLKKKLKREPTFGDIVGTFRKGYPQYFNAKEPTQVNTGYANKSLGTIGGGNKSGGVMGFIKSLLGGE